jgi:hypothetical protein
MPITQGLTTSFKQNCLSGLENFAVGTPYTYKIALYNGNANIGTGTTTYDSTSNELPTSGGYTTGGKILTVIPPMSNVNANTAYVSFANVTWNPASFTCRGALIYNSTTGATVCVLNFGSDKTASNTFTITFPADTSSDAIIRFS